MNYIKYDDFIYNCGIITCNKNIDQIKTDIKALSLPKDEDEIAKYLKWDFELLLCCEIAIEHREKDQGYLFPMLVYTNGTKIPDIESFEPERIDFYKHRLSKVNNIAVKIRYLNYLFEYDKKENRFLHAKELCKNLILSIESRDNIHSCIINLSRLFEISLSFKIKESVDELDRITIDIFEKQYEHEDDLWILSISRIIFNNVKKNTGLISETAVSLILSKIEQLSSYYYDEIHDYSQFRCFCINQIDWYRFLDRKQDEAKTLIKYGISFERQAEGDGITFLTKAYLYESAVQHFINIGKNELVHNLKVKIKESYKLAKENGEYKTISTTQSIAKEELEKYIAPFIGATASESLNKLSHARDFIPHKADIEIESEKDANNPIYRIVGLSNIYGNRKVFDAKSLEDIKRKLLCQRYNITLEIMFTTLMSHIWERMIGMGLTPEMVTDRICSTEYMEEDNKELIKTAIDRFFNDDYVSALHILVPQFENYFRTFFEWGGYATTSIRAATTQQEQTFNDFLHQPFVKDTIEPDLLFMIEFIMVDQLGYNLRNNIAHGLLELSAFRKSTCLMVIYLFFIVTCIKCNRKIMER